MLLCYVYLFSVCQEAQCAEPLTISATGSLRVDVQGKDSKEDQVVVRFSADTEKALCVPLNNPIRLSLFTETRYNYEPAQWSRVEVGCEAGYRLCTWLYAGESIQYALLECEPDTLEAETRLLGLLPIGKSFFGCNRLNLYCFEEWTFGFRRGQATRNEVGVGCSASLTEHATVALGWRHVDRIHDFDSDQIECSIRYVF